MMGDSISNLERFGGFDHSSIGHALCRTVRMGAQADDLKKRTCQFAVKIAKLVKDRVRCKNRHRARGSRRIRLLVGPSGRNCSHSRNNRRNSLHRSSGTDGNFHSVAQDRACPQTARNLKSPIDDCQSIRQSSIENNAMFLTQVSFASSAILTARFSSTLFRAAMPVRHDMAPARESGSLMCSGAGVFLKI